MDIRSLQRPLKDGYRQDPTSSRITLTAHGTQADAPIACSVDLGRAIYKAQARKGVVVRENWRSLAQCHPASDFR